MSLRGWTHVVFAVGLAAPAHAAVPEWSAGPQTVAVAPFENHVPNGTSVQWIVAEAPFEIAEKTEAVLGLAAQGAPLYVGSAAVPAEPDMVAGFGAPKHAAFVVTGWYDKIGEDLRIDVVIWKITGRTAAIAGEAQQRAPMPLYHQILGGALADAWTKAGVAVDANARARLGRALAKDVYPVFMMGRGLGYLTGATGKVDLAAAQHDLERAVFLDPKLYEAQRLIGELELQQAPGDPKAVVKAAAKFDYAVDLAPEDIPSLRAAALATAQQQKWQPALDLFARLVRLQPWDLDARYHLGRVMWELGDAGGAERQLEQVTAHAPDDLRARRVLVLIHASRGDTRQLASELEAIASRAPDDRDVASDLAAAYGALGQWPKAIAQLERIAKVSVDAPLAMRIGDAHRAANDLDGALAWYARAHQLAPTSTMPGFIIAGAQFDAGRLDAAAATFGAMKLTGEFQAAADHDLGAIAYAQHRADAAAQLFHKAVREAPRVLASRRAAVAADLARGNPAAALDQAQAALAGWPDDPLLHYLAGIAEAKAGETDKARDELTRALALDRSLGVAQVALTALDAGAALAVDFAPELVRPWGDRTAIADALDRFAASQRRLADIRSQYQADFIAMLGDVGKGPGAAPGKPPTSCPVSAVAPAWRRAQDELASYDRVGEELESAYRFIARHDEAGLTAGLLPNQRIAARGAKSAMALALADRNELRAEWARGLLPELRAAGCSDALLQAGVDNPSRYHVIAEDKTAPRAAPPPPRPQPRTTFFVDNTGCPDAVDVWIDGQLISEVAPGRRSALVADGGARTLCLLSPGGAQCGDRGTVRQVYLHDGWTVTMHCPK